jgi:hypothetical protein
MTDADPNALDEIESGFRRQMWQRIAEAHAADKARQTSWR